MKFLYQLTCVFVFSFLFSFWCAAQDGAPPQATPKKPGRSFQLACWNDWSKSDIYIGDPNHKGGKMTKVDIFNMSYSKGYSYKIDQPLYFYTKTEDPQKPYEVALKVVIPKSYKKPLIMLILKKDGVRSLLYDLDDEKFPYGSYQIVNFTEAHLYVSFEGQNVKVKPQQKHLVRLKHNKKTKAVQLKAAVEKDGKLKLVYSNMLMNRKNKRMIMFFYPTKDQSDRPSIKSRCLVDFQQK